MHGLTFDGSPLIPGVNVDKLDVAAGVAEAVRCGYSSPNELMLVSYCLSRWVKGEEEHAEATAIHMGMDFTSWRRSLAAAMAAAL